MQQADFSGLSNRVEALSKQTDTLEVPDHLSGGLVEGRGYCDGSKGRWPPFNHVSWPRHGNL